MMIAHVSIPADNCETTARVLADIMQGRAMPFPPGGPAAWMAWSRDGDVELEITPRGAYMVQGQEEAEWEQGPIRRASESHVALCVDRPSKEVVEIAKAAGWRARICDRGGFFHVVEVWVDGAFLIEVLDPLFTEQYKRSVTVDNWMKTFGIGE